MAIISIIYNISMIYMIGYFFYVLLFTAQFDALFIQTCLEIARNLPIIIPLNLFWIKGYHLRNCVASFDNFTIFLLNVNLNGVKIPPPPGCRVKLFLIYLIIILIHTLHFVIQYYDADIAETVPNEAVPNETVPNETVPNKSPGAFVWSFIFGYSIAVLLTLIIPTYCTFCWAVDYELKLFFEYVNVLICTRVAPKYEHFDEFKRCYRKIADDIMFINQLFAIYLSVVIVIIWVIECAEAENLGLRVLNIVIQVFTGDDEKEGVKALTIFELR